MSGAPNWDKYQDALLYLLDRENGANNHLLGKVKLMKLLYYADFDHFERTGQSITGDYYTKKEFGPVPFHADEALRRLQEQELIKTSYTPVFHYYKYSYAPTGAAKPKDLTLPELETLAAVVQKWKNHSTNEIVNASHGDPPWLLTKFGQVIDYNLVRLRERAMPPKDEEPPDTLEELRNYRPELSDRGRRLLESLGKDRSLQERAADGAAEFAANRARS
jgi:uncharacterized phage-associated protein